MTPEQENQFYSYLAKDLFKTSNLQFRSEKDVQMAIKDVKTIIELDRKGTKVSDICRRIGRYKPHAVSKMLRMYTELVSSGGK